MPKAEVGSTRYLNNKLKSKGLQRLRWYCQVCEKQCRDENGFKMHSQSESHVRQMLLVGEDSKKFINNYSNQFQRDFLQLLRTSHGEKQVQMNHFYQEYISNKEHIHMNATKWPSLTEFAKFLGREGICRVEETDKGLQIAWIDNSPEALRRQDAIRKKERQDRGDEEREQMLIREQVRKAKLDAETRDQANAKEGEGELKRAEGEKIKLNFGVKPEASNQEHVSVTTEAPRKGSPLTLDRLPTDKTISPETALGPMESPAFNGEARGEGAAPMTTADKLSMKIGFQSKGKNVFAVAKKNALGAKKVTVLEQPKKMSEAERIMKEEIERKRSGQDGGFGSSATKRQRW